jgi:RimK family alpha-L-glutamate ligase
MKKGLIIYNEHDKKLNEWFVECCLKALNNDEFSLYYKEENEVLDYVNNNPIDFVIFRCRNYSLLNEIELRGIRCFNNTKTNSLANDKYRTYLFFKEHGFPCLETSLDSKDISFPLVMKSLDGHGGKEVYLINFKNELKQSDKGFIYQKFLPNKGDVRLYVLNKKVIGAVKRSNDKDFRSNFSLGGEVEEYIPSKEMKDIAIKISEILDADYIGVDFIICDKGFIVNEIEDPVGARMLLKANGVDAVSLFIKHIKNALLNN